MLKRQLVETYEKKIYKCVVCYLNGFETKCSTRGKCIRKLMVATSSAWNYSDCFESEINFNPVQFAKVIYRNYTAYEMNSTFCSKSNKWRETISNEKLFSHRVIHFRLFSRLIHFNVFRYFGGKRAGDIFYFYIIHFFFQ